MAPIPPPPPQPLPRRPISGIYEVCIGVPSAAAATAVIEHFAQFGFVPPPPPGGDAPPATPSPLTGAPAGGALSAADAGSLYGHASPLTAVRLAHAGGADHGLLRVWTWGTVSGGGVGAAALKAVGARWAAALTTDVYGVAAHARAAVDADGGGRVVAVDYDRGIKKVASGAVYLVEPIAGVVYEPDPSAPSPSPFVGRNPWVSEALVATPTARQVLYQRHDYTVPRYGAVAPAAHFPTSQFTHVGHVTAGPAAVAALAFYADVLGLLAHPRKVSAFPAASEALLDASAADGDTVINADFDDPASSAADWTAAVSGRLHCLVWSPGGGLPDVTAASSPGAVGMTLYTLRARGIDALRARVAAAPGVAAVSGVMANEFGERGFGFVAPDGYRWAVVEWV